MNVISPDKDNPIRFAGSELGADCHICGFFRNPEEDITSCCRLSRKALSAAKRPSRSLIPNCLMITFGG